MLFVHFAINTGVRIVLTKLMKVNFFFIHSKIAWALSWPMLPFYQISLKNWPSAFSVILLTNKILSVEVITTKTESE